MIPKEKEQEDLRRKGDYTLLYIGILRENGGDYKSPVSSVEHFLTTDCKSVRTPNGPTAKLITYQNLSQKKEEEGDHRKKQVYTLLYKDNTSTVLNIQSKC